MQWAELPCWRASNPIISPSLLQHASIQQASRAPVQQRLHLNFADIARHHALQYACTPAQRRPEVHVCARRCGRHSVTHHTFTVNPNMKRTRCAGQSVTCGRGLAGAAAARPRAKCSAGVTSMSGAALWRCCRTGMHTALPRKLS